MAIDWQGFSFTVLKREASLKVAKLLAQEENYDFSASRAYYAMFTDYKFLPSIGLLALALRNRMNKIAKVRSSTPESKYNG